MKSLETKKEIRARLKKDRASLPAEMRQAFSDRIFKAVIGHPLYQNAEEIYCYVAFREEVSTLSLVEYSWKMGKKVAVPKIHVDNSGLIILTVWMNCQKGIMGYPSRRQRKWPPAARYWLLCPAWLLTGGAAALVTEKAFMTLILESIPNTAA